MLEKFSQKWKGISGIAVAAVLLGGTFGMWSPLAANAVDEIIPSMPPASTCADGNGGSSPIEHIDKIIFQPKKWFVHDTLPPMSPNFWFDIKVHDDPLTVKYIHQEVAGALDGMGYSPGSGGTIRPDLITIIDVEYAVICLP